jgi:hypothetical protein
MREMLADMHVDLRVKCLLFFFGIVTEIGMCEQVFVKHANVKCVTILKLLGTHADKRPDMAKLIAILF